MQLIHSEILNRGVQYSILMLPIMVLHSMSKVVLYSTVIPTQQFEVLDKIHHSNGQYCTIFLDLFFEDLQPVSKLHKAMAGNVRILC